MADLKDKVNITVEDLEERLGSKKLREFISDSEKLFVERTNVAIEEACNNSNIKAVFISGPTSSGKTTFTMRLASGLNKAGKQAVFLSLDDYYQVQALVFDEDGRPDFETIDTLDLVAAQRDIADIVSGKTVLPPKFDFKTRQRVSRDISEAITLGESGILVVEGLHGLNKKIIADLPEENIIKIFIMPYGNVFCDTKLMDYNEVRMLRRIVRDFRHRGAHALVTIDYWPMIANSEKQYYEDYLTAADYHINSFLAYEPLIIAPMALHDIQSALDQYEKGAIAPSIFMDNSNTGKPFADLPRALATAHKLVSHLNKIPVIDNSMVPEQSILLEFISS